MRLVSSAVRASLRDGPHSRRHQVWARLGAYLLASVSLAAQGHEVPSDLTAVPLEDLLQVRIVGASKYEQKQEDVAAAVSVITRQEIRMFGWRSVSEALATLPGVYNSYDRQNSYFGMRGFSLPGDYDTRVLILVNGNRLNDPTFDTAPYGDSFPVDIDMVERIEFIPGPGSAVYGQNAMFGVVNIITRDGTSLHGGEVAASAQNPQRTFEGRVSAGTHLESGLDLAVSATAQDSRGENLFYQYGSSGISGVATGLDNERYHKLFGHVEYGAWSFEVIGTDGIKGDPTGAYFSDPLVPGQWQGGSETVTQLRYLDHFDGDRLQVMARVFTGESAYRNLFRYGTYYATPTDGHWHGGELQLVDTALADHTLMAGVEYQDNTAQDQYALDIAHPQNDLVIPGSAMRVGVYVQDEWRIVDGFSATLGMRADRDENAERAYSPRAGLIWHADPADVVKLLYGRAQRAPNDFERNYDDGVTQVANPKLQGERVDTIELDVDHRVAPDLGLRASAYQWRLRDLIVLGTDPVTGLPQYQSGQPVTATGIELSGDKTWDAGARLRGSVSKQVTVREDAQPLLNSPHMLGKLNFSSPLPWAKLRLGYEWQYVSRRLTENGTYVGAYDISNLQLGADGWLPGLDVSLGIYNLLGRSYSDPAAPFNWQNSFEQDGRSVRVKLVYRF
jgi:iron complex outermembrane receptor protein